MSIPERDLRLIVEASKRYRDAKGFYKCEFAILPIRLGLVATEINELADALDAWQASFDPRAQVDARALLRDLRLECADVVMVTGTILDDIWGNEWSVRDRYWNGEPVHADAERVVKPLRKHWDQAFRAWSKNKRTDCMIALELLLLAAIDLQGRITSMPLRIDVENKIEGMRDRKPAHGRDPRC